MELPDFIERTPDGFRIKADIVIEGNLSVKDTTRACPVSKQSKGIDGLDERGIA